MNLNINSENLENNLYHSYLIIDSNVNIENIKAIIKLIRIINPPSNAVDLE